MRSDAGATCVELHENNDLPWHQCCGDIRAGVVVMGGPFHGLRTSESDLAVPPESDTVIVDTMKQNQINVLFLCANNSTRSVIAEALLNRFGEGRFRAFSAGIDPAREVNPIAIELLRAQGLPTHELRTKSWREFCAAEAPFIHFVISFGDTPCEQVCAALPGDPVRACWHIGDPLAADHGGSAGGLGAFRRALRELENRIRLFALLRHGTPERWTRPAAL